MLTTLPRRGSWGRWWGWLQRVDDDVANLDRYQKWADLCYYASWGIVLVGDLGAGYVVVTAMRGDTPSTAIISALVVLCFWGLTLFQSWLKMPPLIAEIERLRREEATKRAWYLTACPDLRFRDRGQLLELAKRAVETVPLGSQWTTLGVAHYRAGNWESAIQSLQRAMEIKSGGDGADWFFVAMAHWQLGRRDDARQWYDRAVEWVDQHHPKDKELRWFQTEAATLLGVPRGEGSVAWK
ncbi:MAG: tetratricopeptide repeat protein [Planctomycetes bacterium]|nr:tetratricopeptide repeat protein [Planctomycetota bacterium]